MTYKTMRRISDALAEAVERREGIYEELQKKKEAREQALGPFWDMRDDVPGGRAEYAGLITQLMEAEEKLQEARDALKAFEEFDWR